MLCKKDVWIELSLSRSAPQTQSHMSEKKFSMFEGCGEQDLTFFKVYYGSGL